jgi:hypothetical protein
VAPSPLDLADRWATHPELVCHLRLRQSAAPPGALEALSTDSGGGGRRARLCYFWTQNWRPSRD